VDALYLRVDYNIGDLKNLRTLKLPTYFLTDDVIATLAEISKAFDIFDLVILLNGVVQGKP
jgi:hypothetical protein